jgi:sugar lactone lactonase YvrE
MSMKGSITAAVLAVVPVLAFSAGLPEKITMKTAGFLPEGVEYDTRSKRFFVGSLAQGTVFIVANDGTLTPFVSDPEIKGSVGLEVDEERNRLLVAVGDRAPAGDAKLGVFDLTTGKRIAMVNLMSVGPPDAKAHFANDLTVGPDGSVYVTDTRARVLYKVSPKYEPSLFLAMPSAERLNGIVTHPHGYLLVAESGAGDVYKVPLDKPASFTKVKLSEQVQGDDGMLWHPDDCLIVVRNDPSLLVLALKSTDDWASAKVDSKATTTAQQTTAALTDSGIYVVHPFFQDAKAMPYLERVTLK